MYAESFTSGASARPQSHTPARYARGLRIAGVLLMVALAGCASRKTQAPVSDMSSGGGSVSAAGGIYVVRPGDTLYKIAQTHNVDVNTLIRLNNISDPSQLRVGQTLRLSGNADMASAPAPAPAPTTPAKAPDTSSATPSRASDAALVSWGWPANGKIIQGFTANTKGIDIEGKVGDPVTAAASGKVMYAGNGVRGLGNLILIGHSNGFITAYAHNHKLMVKTGQEVSKGAKIAEIGQTDTTSPRLHFEIRRSGTPVNPLAYLPSR
ncbi:MULTISPECIES: peptidoglycan DD-metalloendopeptidase family protein [unclassified Pusillimonas]|uniref:peptidoglycan DD-metalloendopeptidase family protein n=1 Tax=unclassified Pusillimonas TaxID=2640016 RepID=UPI000B9CD818|nr:peptidase [Pusillimonas sp. T2]ROT45185.1 peptidase [Pusillimonas sp. NJUB218]